MGDCVQSAAALPFGGVCPASELVCPACPWNTPVKCPSGGCAADVRDCHPNVLLRGACNSTTCEEAHWCHILPRMQYACWEQAPSTQTATMTFSSLDEGRCGTCLHLTSRYQCSSCCGVRGVTAWSGTYETHMPDRDGGGVFMHGSRWVCLLVEVAAGLELGNVAAGLEAPDPPPPLASPPPPPPEPPAISEEEAARAFPMPEAYSLD